ncbi:MAG: 1,4-alpha-glucan branching protein GlgB [Erysipelotrichaceae bacterium]|nr:1,4-alpha-glucan branching protein GlgB [Erysipelotrichaceae bacterium]
MIKKYDEFFKGYELEAYDLFGSRRKDRGVEFTVWAPHACKVEVFTSRNWQEFFPLEKIDERGIWQTFVDDMQPIYVYRYRIWKDEYNFVDKSDPYAYQFEKRPANASIIYDLNYFTFNDNDFLNKRDVGYDKPMNIYEIHLNGFTKSEYEDFTTYRSLKETLIPYLKDMGYNYVEFMPVFEHPYDGSWGYQATGFFGTTSRYGTPYDLMDLVNELHNNGIGVLLDVVYVHFAPDGFALVNFDGQPCYEYREAHLAKSEWGTYCFDLTSGPVVSFLMSSANFFLQKMHFDGLRFDAVSHLIYHQGNKNLGDNVAGRDFLRRITHHLKSIHPQCILIAEDSTDFQDVTKPTKYGGLGFDYKWDLGWMNDTLKYYAMDPVYKQYHHNSLTFSMAYFYSERFILPFSHDEVVHSKKTIIDKMWGDYETKFRLCRNLFVYMYTHPGKKLNFEGNELAMFREFDERKELDWFLLKYPLHDSFKRFMRDLSMIYLNHPAFYRGDYSYEYFKWIDADNYQQSIYSYYRYDDHNCFVTVLNMTPNEYVDYRVGVPFRGVYYELINSEKDIYSGCNMCNFEPVRSSKVKANNLSDSIKITIAPYAAIIFRVRVTREKLEKYRNPKIIKPKEKCIEACAKEK